MDCKSCKTKADIPYIAYESAMARNERTVKRLVAAIIVMAIILCVTIGGFLWYLSQYDFAGEDVTVDASNGHANYIGQNEERLKGKRTREGPFPTTKGGMNMSKPHQKSNSSELKKSQS